MRGISWRKKKERKPAGNRVMESVHSPTLYFVANLLDFTFASFDQVQQENERAVGGNSKKIISGLCSCIQPTHFRPFATLLLVGFMAAVSILTKPLFSPESCWMSPPVLLAEPLIVSCAVTHGLLSEKTCEDFLLCN